MADLVVIVPSRGRPEAAQQLRDAFEETCILDTQLVFAIDKRDAAGIYEYPFDERASTWWSESSTMVEALNLRALELINGEMQGFEPPFAVAFMGDDHRPRTRGWDKQYLDALRELETGIVYGNDLLQGERLPTQCAMTSDIVRALGYMVPPSLIHMYADNFWLTLGHRLDRIRYLPDVLVEHLHPVAGKAEWDSNYARVNDRSVYSHDERAFAAYLRDRFEADVAKIEALL